MIRQVLCDLDGTLIHFDHRLFIKNYVGLLGQKLAPQINPAEFSPLLLSATAHMIQSQDGRETNAEKFWRYLEAHAPLSRERLEPALDEFYATDFHRLQKMIVVAPMQPVLGKIARRGVPVAVATNPVFPRAAVEARLAWGGFAAAQFNLITAYETSRYCKPNPAYYREILDALGCAAADCLMIGNDVSEDLAAGKLGIKTYLITDAVINRGGAADAPADYRGSAADLLRDIDAILSS